jgi:hypothetical protein
MQARIRFRLEWLLLRKTIQEPDEGDPVGKA